jgi:chromosome condensin MukBEF complex kleisin-like MukF subunit
MERDVIPAPDLHRLISKSHEGKWAAISADHKRLVAVSDDLLALEREVRDQAVTVFKVMPSDVGYAPMAQIHRSL